MGRWRNKGEAQPAPAPQKKGKRNPEMRAFNQRLFDPVNATIDHADKLEMQSLANAARGGDPQAVQAYQDKLWNSGLTQEEKLALGEMFKVKQPKRGRGGRIKASPQDLPVSPELKKFIDQERQYQYQRPVRARYGMNGPASRGY